MSNKCPQCGAPADTSASHCKYCGEKLNLQQTQQQNAAYVAPQPMHSPQPVYTEQAPRYTQHFDPGINPSWPIKSKVVAGLLGIFLGSLGIHKFYMGRIGWGIIYLLFCWTYIPAIIGFFEGIYYLVQNEHNFQVKNKVRIR